MVVSIKNRTFYVWEGGIRVSNEPMRKRESVKDLCKAYGINPEKITFIYGVGDEDFYKVEEE